MIFRIWLASHCYWVQETAIKGRQSIETRKGLEVRLHASIILLSEDIQESPLEGLTALLDSDPINFALLGMIDLSPEIFAALKKRPHLPIVSRHVLSSPPATNQPTIELIFYPLNDSDRFHKTHTPNGDVEPEPYAARNYDWSASPQDGQDLLALEQQITELRELR
jgi:hypothetical protein